MKTMYTTFTFYILAVAALLGCTPSSEAASPPAGQPSTDYYETVLDTYVNEAGLVDYKGLQQDRIRLDAYVLSLNRVSKKDFASWSEADQIAFWINAYNALTLRAVVDHYPVKSIKDIGNIIKSVWDKLTFDVMGSSMTLNNIEHDTLRKDYTEPGIHMGLNCASIGCPPLRKQPFTGATLQAELDEQAQAFFADPAKFRIDRNDGVVLVSPIFKWFGKDFIPSFGKDPIASRFSDAENAVLRYIAGRVSESDSAYILEGNYRIDYLDYDWDLNEQGRN